MRLPSGRSRQRGQSIVEFGIIALTFVLLMFAVVDLGMLVNSWVRLSGTTRDVARLAAVGYQGSDLESMVRGTPLPGVSPNVAAPFSGYCCLPDAGNKIELRVAYYDHCIPPATRCDPITNTGLLLPGYWPRTGGCTEPTPPPPAPPPPPRCHPQPGDTLIVSVAAPGMEVITPLVRPFFASSRCQNSDMHCYVRLGSSTMVRFEGGRTGV